MPRLPRLKVPYSTLEPLRLTASPRSQSPEIGSIFDINDIGTHLAQQAGTMRCSNALAEVQDLHAFEGLVQTMHLSSP